MAIRGFEGSREKMMARIIESADFGYLGDDDKDVVK